MITLGEGRYKVWLEKHQVGDDLVFLLGGGEKPHIGGAVLCEPGKPPVLLTKSSHQDVKALEIIAAAACKKYTVTCVAVGGIHIDNASKEEINRIMKICHRLSQQV